MRNILIWDLEEKNWAITCVNFAPNAPQENPLEDIWLCCSTPKMGLENILANVKHLNN